MTKPNSDEWKWHDEAQDWYYWSEECGRFVWGKEYRDENKAGNTDETQTNAGPTMSQSAPCVQQYVSQPMRPIKGKDYREGTNADMRYTTQSYGNHQQAEVAAVTTQAVVATQAAKSTKSHIMHDRRDLKAWGFPSWSVKGIHLNMLYAEGISIAVLNHVLRPKPKGQCNSGWQHEHLYMGKQASAYLYQVGGERYIVIGGLQQDWYREHTNAIIRYTSEFVQFHCEKLNLTGSLKAHVDTATEAEWNNAAWIDLECLHEYNEAFTLSALCYFLPPKQIPKSKAGGIKCPSCTQWTWLRLNCVACRAPLPDPVAADNLDTVERVAYFAAGAVSTGLVAGVILTALIQAVASSGRR